MKTVLYADVLFLINFGMDLISLWLTFLIVHQKTDAVRLVVSSALGGAYGVAAVAVALDGVPAFIISIAVSVIMVMIGTAGRLKFSKYIKYSFILWGIGALLGGAVTVVCSLGKGSAATFKSHNSSFFVFALAAAFCTLVVRMFQSHTAAKSCDAEIYMFGDIKRVSLLCDSGNFASEPISGAPVIFIKKEVFLPSSPNDVAILTSDKLEAERLTMNIRKKTRVITVERAGGAKTLLCIFPDRIIIINGKKSKAVKAAVVIEDTDGYAGFDGVIPAALLK